MNSHHDHHHEHELPASGAALTRVAISATLHCLTGCAIGEIAGMAIGTALGFSEWGTVALAVTLAFLFGYALTSLPLLRAGFAFSAVVPIALAADTISITTMEIVDNGIMLAMPGAMEAGLGSLLFWGTLAFALVVAGVVTVPVNRWLIARRRGHAVVHATGIHGGPSPRVVGAVAVVAAIFGTTVLVTELVNGGGDHGMDADTPAAAAGDHEADAATPAATADDVPGLAVSAGDMTLELADGELPRSRRSTLRFRITDAAGAPVRDFEVEQEKRMHLIVVRRDMTGFQHLHPEIDAAGEWSTPITLDKAGSYRVFADFARDGTAWTLAADLAVDGPVDSRPMARPAPAARTASGYEVALTGRPVAGRETELRFEITRGGEHVDPQDYLGAQGHLVALREGDLAYLHTHPVGEDGHGEAAAEDAHGEPEADGVRFAAEFPTAGRYALFLQFRHEGRVHTAPFTVDVARPKG